MVCRLLLLTTLLLVSPGRAGPAPSVPTAAAPPASAARNPIISSPPASSPPISSYATGTITRISGSDARVTLSSGRVVTAALFDAQSGVAVGRRVTLRGFGDEWVVQNPLRTTPLLVLLLVFVGVAVLLGRSKGLRAVIGTAASLAVLVLVVVPRLASGQDAFSVTVLGAALILAVTIYFVHGLNRKSSAALAGTLLTAVFGAVLSLVMARALWLSGTASEAGLAASSTFALDPLRLYLAGVVIGVLGALNDVTVTQASVVQALAHVNPVWSARELYRRAMTVGFDHVGSLINVLVLAYAATSLPLLLLVFTSSAPLWAQLSDEGFASELSNVLIGSLCVVVAVPLTTLVAALAFRGGRHAPGPNDHGHVH